MGAVRMMVIAAAISAAVVSQLGYWSPNALELTHQGVLPPPSGRVVKSFDLDAACRQLGFEADNASRPATSWAGQLQVSPGRSERLSVSVKLGEDSMAARQWILSLPSRNNGFISYRVAPVPIGAKLPPARPGSAPPFSRAEGPPIAGEISAAVEDFGRALSFVSFVRDNCLVDAHLVPWVDGRSVPPDAESTARLVEFVQGLDKLLIAASEAEEGENPWTPNIDAILIELPMPAAGRPFTIDARVAAAGEPAPALRLKVSWQFRHREHLDRAIVSSPDPITTLGVTSARVELDEPGWWVVTCRADLDGSLHGERRMLLYVLPADAGLAEPR